MIKMIRKIRYLIKNYIEKKKLKQELKRLMAKENLESF
jgi:hypothetical protein